VIGETLLVYGYPLAGALASAGNATTGIVSAAAGLRDDRRFFQMTAPVQPGNSGGPVLDQSGRVIGVVQSKLNALRVMRATGDVPQNVNFAVNIETLRPFLSRHRVPFRDDAAENNMRSPDLAASVQRSTVLVICLPAPSRSIPSEQPNTQNLPRLTGRVFVSDARLNGYQNNRTFIVSNGTNRELVAFSIGSVPVGRQVCPTELSEYHALRRFDRQIGPKNNATVVEDFGREERAWCIVRPEFSSLTATEASAPLSAIRYEWQRASANPDNADNWQIVVTNIGDETLHGFRFGAWYSRRTQCSREPADYDVIATIITTVRPAASATRVVTLGRRAATLCLIEGIQNRDIPG
jgi:hypothetical protein